MEGVQCRGRQPKRWLDNITEWTGLSIGDAVKMTQDRDVWRSFVSLASTVHDHETMRHDDDDKTNPKFRDKYDIKCFASYSRRNWRKF